MKDDDHSFNMFAAVCVVASFLLFIATMIIAAGIINGVSPEGVARCKSLQGEYGGGKCFKDGREI